MDSVGRLLLLDLCIGFDPVMKIDGRRKYVKRYMEKLIKDREKGKQKEKEERRRLNSTRSSRAMEDNDVPVRMSCIRTKDQRSQCCGG